MFWLTVQRGHNTTHRPMTIYTQSLLTIAGISQHLSRLVQPKLQTISNIWSWNCGRDTREGKRMLHMASIERRDGEWKKQHAHMRPLKRTTDTIESVRTRTVGRTCESEFGKTTKMHSWLMALIVSLMFGSLYSLWPTVSLRRRTLPLCQELRSPLWWCCWRLWSVSRPPPDSRCSVWHFSVKSRCEAARINE